MAELTPFTSFAQLDQSKIGDLAIYQYNALQKKVLLDQHLLALTKIHQHNCVLYGRFINAYSAIASCDHASDIPPFAVRHFKEHKLSSTPVENHYKTLHSSGTTGNPSTIILDSDTAKLQSKVLVKTLQHWLGKARLPMLIIDAPNTASKSTEMTARAAGINGFAMFGRDHHYALNDNMQLNVEVVTKFFEKYQHEKILLFGFTAIVWQQFICALKDKKLAFNLSQAILFHGGGWKKMLEHAVTKQTFKSSIQERLGNISIHDYYGMVEQTGTIHIECEHGYLHTPIWADVLIRRASDLTLAATQELGLIQVNSIIAQSYPGHCLLTEDLGMIIGEDDCPCGRKGKYFIVQGRVPLAEKRGCSDTFS